MQESSEEIVEETVSEESDQKTKRGLFAGLLLATGTVFVLGAKLWSKIDLAKMRQRLLHGKSLPLESNEQAGGPEDLEGQEEAPAPTKEPVNTPDEPDV